MFGQYGCERSCWRKDLISKFKFSKILLFQANVCGANYNDVPANKKEQKFLEEFYSYESETESDFGLDSTSELSNEEDDDVIIVESDDKGAIKNRKFCSYIFQPNNFKTVILYLTKKYLFQIRA